MSLHDQRESVFVRRYTRVRFGETEHVCAHYRSWPNSLN